MVVVENAGRYRVSSSRDWETGKKLSFIDAL